MSEPIKVSPSEARRLMAAGDLLVALYPEPTFREHTYIEGAISWDTFQQLLPSLSKEAGLIFY